MNLVPLYDRVIIRRIVAQTKTERGIIIPENTAGETAKGTVIATGPGYWDATAQNWRPLTVKVGDTVCLRDLGAMIRYRGEELLIMPETSILAIESCQS